MTRKHYEKVAQQLRAYHLELVSEFGEGESITNTKLDTVQDIADILADIFQEDNPRFDKSRFASACVPAELVGK